LNLNRVYFIIYLSRFKLYYYIFVITINNVIVLLSPKTDL